MNPDALLALYRASGGTILRAPQACLPKEHDYLLKPAREIEAKGYSPIEIASAYLILTHHVLYNHYPKDKIDEAFDALSFFAKRRIEHAAQQKKQGKSSALH